MIFYDNYVAIIGDIADSKKLKNRKALQQKFKTVLTNINDKYSEDIAAKFSITLGDEFQGLLQNRDRVIEIIMDIEKEMGSVELRFGIGIGEISTDIDFENSAEVDGPAYHRARKMMTEMEQKRSQYTERHMSIMVCSNEDNQEIDELLNSILSVCTALKSKWTERQKEIINSYLNHNQNQYKAAEKLKIGQPSVNKALKAARFYSYKSAMDTVNTFLSQKGGGKDG